MTDRPNIEARAISSAFLSHNTGETIALLEARHTTQEDAASIFIELIETTLKEGNQQAIQSFYAAMPEDFAFRGIVEYGLACIAGQALQLDALSRWMRQGMRHIAQAMPLLRRDKRFVQAVLPFFIQQAFLYEPADYDPGDLIPEPQIEFLPPQPPMASTDGAMVFTAANGIFFDHFFPAFAKSLRHVDKTAVLHAHVINPTLGSQEIMEEMRHDKNIRFSRETADRERSYFACNRFLTLPTLLERYGRPIIVSDIDTLFTASPAPLLKAANQDVCFGYFKKPGPAPSLLYHAQLLVFRPTIVCQVFLDTLTRFIRAKLAEHDVWLIDQTALLRAAATLQENHPGSIIELSNSLGSVDKFQTHNLETQLKRKMRGIKDEKMNFRIDADGKPHFMQQGD